jgi:signal transduction histidine kinase
MTGLLGLGLGVYLLMAVTSFKSDKTQLVFDLTRSQVSNLTSELETEFTGASEKLKVFALLPGSLQNRMAEDLLTESSSVVAISLFKSAQPGARPDKIFHQERFLETYGLTAADFDGALAGNSVPFDEILKNGEDIWNASLESGPPLIGYGRLVVVQDQKGVPVEQWVVAGYIRLDKFLKSVSTVSLSEIFVSNRRGEVLVHPDAKWLTSKPKVAGDPFFKEAVAAQTKVSVAHRNAGVSGVLAAFAKGYNGQVFVVAKASESQVFKVVRDLFVRTLLFGSLVLTLVILASFLVSRSLTENIDILTDRMESAARGDLSTKIKLKGRDETIILANTFNQMINDLKDSRDALETMNRELDQKVKERTEQLEEQHRKVKEVQEALVQTTRLASVGEVAGRTAHEVLNPLTILLTRLGLMQKRAAVTEESPLSVLEDIRKAWNKDYRLGGFTKLIKNWEDKSNVFPGKNLFEEDLENVGQCVSSLSEQSRNLSKDLAFVKDEGERIGKIINGMRELGQSRSDYRNHSAHAILSDCCDIMSDMFETKGFKIEQRFEATDYTCLVDRDELIQALTNLMRNSLQAMDEAVAMPNRILRLRTYNKGQQLVIEIEDNGIGIALENQSRLFESSFTTKAPDEGTGLGLGIARRFIRAQNGEIEFVTSSPLEKTVFRIRLPLAADSGRQGAVA